MKLEVHLKYWSGCLTEVDDIKAFQRDEMELKGAR